jgi:prepilin-type N-terminal cleavage/methylation domain-containing protein
VTRNTPRRGGFTLIELLTVIAIITMLAAITTAGVSRVRTAQQTRNTEQTLTKLQLALDQKLQTIADQVALDRKNGKIPSQIVTGCGNDLDKAAAAWAYVMARRDMPNSFAEATTAFSVTIGANPPYVAQPRKTFAGLSGSYTPQEEAAILLYLILSETDSRGANFNADDATSGAQATVGSYRVFVDAWRTPITFLRFASGGFNGELNAAPYVNTANTVSQDPFDPKGKLKNDSTVSGALSVCLFSGMTGSATAINGTNRQPAVISAGYNKTWGNMFDEDNVVGYRLRKQGARGD